MATLEALTGNVEPRGLEEEMRSSYLDYAMSVIVGRALPDVRDGLKPVHRRVLFSMNENGLQPNRPYAKSARIVGDVMGKYHPHGDSAIYDTLVRLAQDFSMRYPLIDGQSGIAVGMATNIPPHNLREAIAATIAYIDDPEIETAGLMRHLRGPDFPTGGVILGLSGIREAYETGRGRVRVRAKAHVEQLRGNREAIVVTELPFMVKKGGDSGVIRKIVELYNEKKLTEISDIQDHSDRNGMRVVIE